MPPLRSTGQSSEAEHPEYAGQYRLESCLGTGGMGVVHLATSASGLRLAVKVIHGEHASDPEFRARFRQEIAAARRVSGAFTASVVDADSQAGRPWMATLFIDGPTLAERVKRNPLESAELRRVGAGLAEALRDIHRAGVVHRDLKPSNVLLAPDGPKVIDFGISRPTDSDLRTETGKLIGTPPFMAPEQFQRPREVGPAADVFALGSVLVHAATGRGPFDSDSAYIVAYQVVHDEPDLTGVPADLVPLLQQCLAKDPDERPTPYEVMVALRESTPSTSYDTQAYIPVPRTPDPSEDAPEAVAGGQLSRRRHRLWWVAAGAAVAALVTAGITGVRLLNDDSAAASPEPVVVSRGFTGWNISLGKDGEHRTPVCTTGAGLPGLYCAAPGVKAVRLDPELGKSHWSKPADGSGGNGRRGGEVRPPVLAGGLVHVVSPNTGRLEALDPKSGAVRWSAPISSYATVRHIGDVVLLVSGDGTVRAVDAATGDQRWVKRHGGVGTQWVSASTGKEPALAATPAGDGASTLVIAVDPATGEQLWEKQLTGTLSPVWASGGALYLLSMNADDSTDAVVRLGTEAGAQSVRRVDLDVPIDQAQAMVVGDVAYLSSAGGALLAVAMKGGGLLWRLETLVTHLSRPAADANTVYVTAADGRLLAVDAVRGQLIGQTKPRMADGRHTFSSVLHAPVITRGRVLGTAPDGSVFAVDATSPGRW
ncbi:protein kinase domain-containing protein [Streptomyces albipurpureus]|uniref:PQQ-binding-like beta-propeller repeat protein n=1 Tax=Streptomyces albipurpureus TaxID=2897419 RepID=A0ABT0UZ10_9ACTN|nr:serine/threonine-protein kinase [Streptomyces sp. CWNU-1]MCM2393792.1 PQQ-binding-like beta-propeller repeat protein [Streptomyces sp. CWNU-1]